MEIPEPLQKITERQVQWPTVASSAIPIHALPVIVKNNIALANKPASLPPHPTIAQTLTALPLSLQFSFNQVTLPIGATNVISSYRVYRNTSANNFSGATLMRTFVHDPTRQGAITVQDNTGGGKTYYYFVTSVDTTSLESTPVGAQAGAVTSSNANPNISSPTPTTSSPQTTSTTFATLAEMTSTITTKGNPVLVIFSGTFIATFGTAAAVQLDLAIFRDGSQIGNIQSTTWFASAGSGFLMDSFSELDQPAAGSHTYTAQWRVGPGQAGVGWAVTNNLKARQLQVIELG